MRSLYADLDTDLSVALPGDEISPDAAEVVTLVRRTHTVFARTPQTTASIRRAVRSRGWAERKLIAAIFGEEPIYLEPS